MKFFCGSALLILVLVAILGYSTSQSETGDECKPVVNNIYIGEDKGCFTLAGPDQGSPGKRGQKGDPGEPGIKGSSYTATFGTTSFPARNCKEIKTSPNLTANGIYYIKDDENNVFATYCDMVTGGGGWTLVASVHENNMRGKCTSGDRWSSEQGNSADHPHGDGFWGNRATHGMATSATSDDYKNTAYFNMIARDLMIWHVPNDKSMAEFESSAILKYHTTSGFLSTYGGNLRNLFSKPHFPMLSKTYTKGTDNGPSIPITWDRGSNAEILRHTGENMRNEVDAGYVQFRAINNEANAFALCSGVRMKTNFFDAEVACVGSTSHNIGHVNEEDYCGDFSAMDWMHNPGYKTSDEIRKSSVLIFYR